MYKGDDRSNERKRKARNTSTSSISLCSEFDSSEIKDSVEKVVKREHCRNMFKQNNHLNFEVEKCPICLKALKSQTFCVTDSCDYHTFCLDCLETWSKNKSICPVDRKEFKSILVLDVKGKIIKQIAIKAPQSDNSSSKPSQLMTTYFVCAVILLKFQKTRIILVLSRLFPKIHLILPCV
ncbi:hypothetical protein ABEB36_002874 [Hypothenemus hampei]|uniref:RING-type domain-containing protein n=1 Tax=Hypothenemus hampei TaxID=57062 RepID=A0ABD1F7A6_HYPHA